MKLKLVLLFAIILSSCGTKYGTTKSAKQMKEVYLQEFKISYFESLLRKGFNNQKGYNDAVKIDRSHFTEPVLSNDDYKLIDSLTTVGNNFMVTDSIQSIGRRAEGAEGKRVLKYALERYNSKWLDSISKEHLKIYLKKEANFRKSLNQ